jgi:hypothetical protein
MTSLNIMGLISTIALFLPIVLIFILKLYKQRSFLVLSIYYAFPAIYNLAQENVIYFPKSILRYFGIVSNLLDAPLMLVFLCLFSYSPILTRRISIAIYAFIFYEVMIISVVGFNTKAITCFLGLGILLVLIVSYLLFARQVKLIITQQKGPGKALMTSAVFSSYTIFGIIYLFYFLLKLPNVFHDALLMYYIVSLISALLMTGGIWIENKRIKKLKELKHTRRELAVIYGRKDAAVPPTAAWKHI